MFRKCLLYNLFIFLFLITFNTEAQPLTRFQYNFGKLGTVCNVVFYAPDSATSQKAIEAVFTQIDSLNRILSDYDESSEIRKICSEATENKQVAISKPLYEIIEQSLYFSKLTQGAFDITVGNYVLLWRRARRQKIFPTEEQLRKAKATIGYKKIKLFPEKQAIAFKIRGMRLDVGAIGKGYIADKILQMLKLRFNISQALIDLGGDISLGDAPPEKTGWSVQTSQQTWVLANCAIATSGDTFQFVEFDGKRYSHIVNPKTGLGLTNSLQVTVIAPDGTAADALASAASVLGEKKTKKMLKKLKKISSIFQILYY